MNTKPKMRTCKCGCRQKFMPRNSLQVAATPECALVIARKKREKDEVQAKKVERKATREAKEKLKTRRDYMKEAQIAFNAYIRERDRDKPCICCGAPLAAAGVSSATGGEFDCGHYRSVGSAPHLRFDERNAHGQTKRCNRYGAGRAVDYRIGLVARIGLESVEALESDNEPRKWSIDDLKRIRDEYRAKRKELEKSRP